MPLRRLALRFDIVDRPGPRKAHATPVPYLGGVAVLVGLVTSVSFLRHSLLPVALLLALITALGAFDDLRSASVVTKLATEGSIALAAVMLGFSWHITDSPLLNGGITIVWLVGLSNSFNLLDNMDGLASSIALVALAGLALLQPAATPLAVPLAACVLGFLLFNLPPARMFLGDAGSLSVGFGVGLVTVIAANSAHGLHSLVLLAFPVVLALFDTSLVIVSRLRTRRPIQLGGRDHFSHRLHLLGWSDRKILAAASAATAGGVLAACLAGTYPGALAWLAVPIAAGYLSAWWLLLGVDPYRAAEGVRPEVVSA
jgi:UDP-GlcNAc:undecaprenyl-phosphate GlcNAc-1-phosphate transferase